MASAPGDKTPPATAAHAANVARLAESMRPMLDQHRRLAESMRPMFEKYARLAESMRPMFEKYARMGEGLARAVTVPDLSALRETFRRWQAMTPRQRARALLADLRGRAGGYVREVFSLVRAALGRFTDELTRLLAPPRGAPCESSPPAHAGPSLALVLLDSARPVHGPPVPA